jgi:hypothetical protein
VQQRGNELFEAAAKLAKAGQYDYAADLFFICVSSDTGNVRYVRGLVETLQKKFGNHKNIGPLAMFKELGARDALEEAVTECDWVEAMNRGLTVLMVNPWDAPTLEALAAACENMAAAAEGPSQSGFADCALFYQKCVADLPHRKSTAVSNSPRQAGPSNTMPSGETSQGNAPPTVFRTHWVVLALLVFAHAVFGAYCTPADRALACLTAGAMIAQPVLLAIWAAFAHQKFYFRVLWSLLVCTYLSFADDLGVVQQKMRPNPGETIMAHLALFVVTLLILLLVRRFSRWRITVPDGEDPRSVFLARNYGIHHLLMLTAIVALACGLVRSLIRITDAGFPYSSAGDFIGSLGLLLVTVFPACVVPWITLARRRKRFALAFVTLLIAVVVDFPACYVVALNTRPLRWSYTFWDTFCVVTVEFLATQFGAILSALGTTLVMRWSGFRMIPGRKTREDGS